MNFPYLKPATAFTAVKTNWLRSGVPELDTHLGGGLPPGALYQWGLPLGREGRKALLCFLRHSKPLTLWVYDPRLTEVYPPSWQAFGIDLSRTYFAATTQPLKDLRQVFLEPLFACIVIDTSTSWKNSELAFLAQQARIHNSFIFLVHNFFLRQGQSSPYLKLRLNCFFSSAQQLHILQTIRGPCPPQSLFRVPEC